MTARPQENRLRVLWVDDDQELTADLSNYLAGEGYDFDNAYDLESAGVKLASNAYDVVLVDLALPDGSGLSLVRATPRSQVREFVVLTGHGSVKTAVEALRHEVFDYLIKPVELSELRNVLTRVRTACGTTAEVLSEGRTHRDGKGRLRSSELRSTERDADAARILIGNSSQMQRAQELLTRAGPSEITVLIQGESGTGKEVAARCIHQLSGRANGPFVALNCAAIAPTLIASELFGHEKGSFTGADRSRKGIFERAEDGTLFLDEVTEMPLDMQGALLRVLETGTVVRVGGDREIPVNARVVAATNRDPMQYVEQGRFRLDLYFRLQVFPVILPPLRERSGDILMLAQHFLSLSNSAANARPLTFSVEALRCLQQHDWPGNVRELRNAVERARLLSSDVIMPEHLMLSKEPSNVRSGAINQPNPLNSPLLPVGTKLRDMEQQIIRQTVEACGGNKTQAAAQLGISIKTLYNKLKRLESLDTSFPAS